MMEYTVTIPVGWVILTLTLTSLGLTLFVYIGRLWYWWDVNKRDAIGSFMWEHRLDEFEHVKDKWYRNIIVVWRAYEQYPNRYTPYFLRDFIPPALIFPALTVILTVATLITW